MNAQFVTWTIVAMCLTVAGCGSDSPSIPSAPTPSTPPPAPAPPPPPPPPPRRSTTLDLTGNYALTFEAGNGCELVPKELRSRTYEARIRYHNSYESTDNFLAELSGVTFVNQQPVWIEVTQQASGTTVWLDLAPSDNVILEELEGGAYFMAAGWEGLASVEPTDLSTISASLTGYFNYCLGTRNHCSFDAMLRSMCVSENSRWTLTRR